MSGAQTSNLSQAHVTCDIIGVTIWGISVQCSVQQWVLTEYRNFDALMTINLRL